MYKVYSTNTFKKDIIKAKKSGLNINELNSVIKSIANNEILDTKYKDNALKGNWIGYRECHIRTDWIWVYRIVNEKLLLVLQRTGTHSELFKK